MTDRTGVTVSAQFRERFEVLEVIGKGASGVVLLAKQKALNRRVAVKYLSSTKRLQEELKKRFLREAKLLSELDHPNIVSIFEYGIDVETPYLVQEYLSGKSLDEILERHGGLPWRQVVAYTRQIASGLAYAHDNGVIHRDLKPANLFLTENSLVEILDFGLAKAPGKHTTLTKTGSVVGTPVYMPPEMLRGKKAGPAGDIYSLGSTVFEMLSNALPYNTQSASFFKDKLTLPPRKLTKMTDAFIPRRLVSLVELMLDIDPDERPTATEVVKHLEDMAAMSDLDLANEIAGRGKPLTESDVECGVDTDAQKAPEITRPTERKSSKALQSFAAIAVLVVIFWVLVTRQWAPQVKVLSFNVKAGIDEAHVSWQTDRKVATGVEQGPVGHDVTTTWNDQQKSTTRHELKLTGLRPQERYAVTILFGKDRRGPTKIFSTLPTLKISHFSASDVTPTAITFNLKSSQEAKAIFEVRDRKSSKLVNTYSPEDKGPNWRFRALGLPAASAFTVKAKVTRGTRHAKEHTVDVSTPPAKVHIIFSGGVHREKANGEVDIESLMHSKTKARAALNLYKDCLVFSHDKRALFRLNTKSGKLVWSHKYKWHIIGIRVYDNRVYLIGRQRRVHCCSFESGRRLWFRKFPKQLAPHFFADSYGVVVWRNDLGPVRLEPRTGETLRPIDNAVLKPLWTITSKGKLFAFSEFYDLWCYDLITGKRRNDLRVVIPQIMLAHPIAVAEEIFAGLIDGSIIGGPPGKNRRLQIKTNERQVRHVAYDGNIIYAATFEPIGIHAASLETGKRLWTFRPPSRPKTPLFARDGYLYYADKRNYLVCLNGKTGQLLYQVYGNVMMQFAVIPADDGALFCSSLLDVSHVKDR